MTTLPTSAKELFERLLPQLLLAHREKAKELGGVYGFRLTGDAGGEWTVNLKIDPPAVLTSLDPQAECTMSMAHADFLEILANPSTAMAMFLQGKIKVEGNPMLALKFQKLFTLG